MSSTMWVHYTVLNNSYQMVGFLLSSDYTTGLTTESNPPTTITTKISTKVVWR